MAQQESPQTGGTGPEDPSASPGGYGRTGGGVLEQFEPQEPQDVPGNDRPGADQPEPEWTGDNHPHGPGVGGD